MNMPIIGIKDCLSWMIENEHKILESLSNELFNTKYKFDGRRFLTFDNILEAWVDVNSYSNFKHYYFTESNLLENFETAYNNCLFNSCFYTNGQANMVTNPRGIISLEFEKDACGFTLNNSKWVRYL